MTRTLPRWITLTASHCLLHGRGQDSLSWSGDREKSVVLSNAAFFLSQTVLQVTDPISLFTLAAGKLRMTCMAHLGRVCTPVHIFVPTSFLIPSYGPAIVFLSPLSIRTAWTRSTSLWKLPELSSGRGQSTDNIFIAKQ